MKIKIAVFAALFCSLAQVGAQENLSKKLQVYVEQFNANDNEAVINKIPNKDSYDWMAKNIPLLDCPDEEIEQTYYFRWWSYRKHIKSSPEGTLVTEFIEPVKHAGKYNSISCALGHHLYEGRWLKDNAFLKEYIDFWLYHADKGQSKRRFHQFSSWLPDALLAYYKVSPDDQYIKDRLLDLDKDFEKWEAERKSKNGLFWQYDVQDGMEESVSGGRRVQNMRPSINSYMYGNAVAIATIAKLASNADLEKKYKAYAKSLRIMVLDSLWDKEDQFFKTKLEKGPLHPTREAIGYIPWYFHLPPDKTMYGKAWLQLPDTAGFNAPWGTTTAERREPTFRTRGTGHSCEWDGAIWPFTSSQTIRGMANYLSDYKKNNAINTEDLYEQIHKYAKSHVMNGKPYIGEYQDEKNGEWLKGDNPRSKFYNHSTFADVIIQDLIGIKPQVGNVLEIKPLIPKGTWDYFSLTQLNYHQKTIAIYWDVTGKKYQKGKGLTVYVDGKMALQHKNLKNCKINLN
ncbi:glycosyl hydrolase family 65 protein [Sphingobacterium sp. N143]|uniref:MGH1-like glycoside hydrolase domain-containing protein n=1 Tax=Sphingobacterium sp. N143 TaxID=2746727 RepID=UPI0025752518|nr:glycosyl hydrolase family 65 protein [Sphingobacterium sp. N143]